MIFEYAMIALAVCANLSRVLVYWRTIAWKPAVQFTLASLPGILLGAQFLKAVPEQVFLGFMGAVLILVLPTRRYLKRTTFEPGAKTVAGLGFLFGVMSGTAAGSGMLVIAFFNSIGLSGPMLLGTDALIGLVNTLTGSGTFYAFGLLGHELILLGLFMGLVTFPVTWLASRVVRLMGTPLHNRLIEILIALSGGLFIIRAMTQAVA